MSVLRFPRLARTRSPLPRAEAMRSLVVVFPTLPVTPMTGIA